ncbi:MAG: NAD(P)-dependent oxidoreductase, partial [Syntrophothermus sp.]
IAVFGAGGRTGLLTVFQALDKGHVVTAFARTPEKVTIKHKNLTIIQGNILDYEKVKEAVTGQDAIILTIGTTGRKYTTELSDGTVNIIKAMKETGVKRLICMSSAGILGNDGGFVFGKIIMPLFLKQVFQDKIRQMKVIMESDLEWVILRPTGLTDSPKTGKYKVSNGAPGGRTVPRADVADFMLKLLTDKQYDGQLPSVSSK